MLTYFTVEHKTDGKTICRINVEPQLKQLSGVVTVDRLIVCMFDEKDTTFRSIGSAEWSQPNYFSSKASNIAKAWSPFWRAETAA